MVVQLRETDVSEVLTEATSQLFATWGRPWLMLASWNLYWGDQWSQWVRAVASGPNPWLPALATERKGQPAAIDFFLPWIPPGPLEGGAEIDEKEAVKAMIRAATPHVGKTKPSLPKSRRPRKSVEPDA